MKTGYRGTFVISWAQTEVDGLHAPPRATLGAGSTWRWRGEALRVDGPADVLRLEPGAAQTDLRRHATRMVHRLVGRALGSRPLDTPEGDGGLLLDTGFELTDGHASWRATLIETGREDRALLMFVNAVPPEGRELWVVRADLQGGRVNRLTDRPIGVICFTPGTRIRCETGERAVEELREGDRIQTRDNGAREILWIGRRRITGARLHAMPELRPIRLRAGALGVDIPDRDLVVSPRHRVLLSGPRAQALFGCDEVLARAEDLIDERSVLLDHAAREVTYIHLLLERHEVIWANGVATESFHPAAAPLESIEQEARARLLGLLPAIAHDPAAYGDFARRTLSRGEAAILRADAA